MYVGVACHVLLAAVFLAAAGGKLRNRSSLAGFVTSVRELRMLPATLARPVALAVVSTEVAVPLLLAGPVPRLGDAAALGLLTVLTAGVGAALARRTPAACRCFGGAPVPLGARHVVRNGVLAGVAVSALASPTPAAAHPGGLAVAAAVGLVLAAFVIRFDDVAELFAGASPGTSSRAGAPTSARRPLS